MYVFLRSNRTSLYCSPAQGLAQGPILSPEQGCLPLSLLGHCIRPRMAPLLQPNSMQKQLLVSGSSPSSSSDRFGRQNTMKQIHLTREKAVGGRTDRKALRKCSEGRRSGDIYSNQDLSFVPSSESTQVSIRDRLQGALGPHSRLTRLAP